MYEYGKGLAVEFVWVGMSACSSQLVVLSILEFVNQFEGGFGIMQSNQSTLKSDTNTFYRTPVKTKARRTVTEESATNRRWTWK